MGGTDRKKHARNKQEEEARRNVNSKQLEDKGEAYLQASEQSNLQSEQRPLGSCDIRS